MAREREYDIEVRGLSGWDVERRKRYLKLEEENERLKEELRILKGLPEVVEPDPEFDLSTPEGRFAAVKHAAATGDIEFAPDDRGGFVIQWSEKGIGFGELTIWMNEDGSIECDDECSSHEFCEAVLLAVAKKWVTLSDKRERN